MTQTPHVEMAVAINLNDQQPPGAVKIRNVWAYTLLTAKLDSELPSPKRLPQSPFRLCWIVSLFTPFIQRGLAVENTNWLLVHDSIPPTMTPVSITTTHPLPASPFKRGRSLSGPFSPLCDSVSRSPAGAENKKARTLGCGLVACPGRAARGGGLLAAGAGIAGGGGRLATGGGGTGARLLALHLLVALHGATDLGGLLVTGALAILL